MNWILAVLSFAALADTRPVDLPKGCLGVKFPCAVTHQTAGVWSWSGAEYSVSKDTSLVLLGPDEMQLISGDLWAEKGDQLKLKHGIFSFKASGDFMFNRRGKVLQIINLDGSVEVAKSGVKNEVLPAGFSNWYEGLGQTGELQQGVMAPWSVNDLSILLKRLPTQQGSINSRLGSYKRNRKNAVNEGSKLYSQVTEMRRIAQENQESARAANARKQRLEKEKIRQLFRDKYYNP